jgi:ATP-dependent Clp protease protease subunit
MSEAKDEFKANLEAALEHGIDIKGRRIFLQGDVEADTIAVAIRGMYLMADGSDEPINLYIASYGGDIDETFALHDVTRTIRVPVHTTALGMCMSAAPFLVACGQPGERYASENCEFMLHTASLELDGTMLNMEGTVEATKRRCERMDRLLAKYTNMPYRHWQKFSKASTDHYFGAEQALEWGLIDQIWSEKD